MKKGLGKGLAALIENNIDGNSNAEGEVILNLNIDEIRTNKNQPRKNFDEDKLNELADSIKEHGIIQPIIVKKMVNYYQIVAGERRYRASQIAGLKEIPAIVKDYNPKEMMEIALIENIQRENLNPLEEAEAYQNLLDTLNIKQEELAIKIGKSRSVIANTLRLLKLNDKVKMYLVEKTLSNAHARTIVNIEDHELQEKVADIIIDKNMSVRQTEEYVKTLFEQKPTKISQKPQKSSTYKIVEENLKNSLGTKIVIKPGKNKSKIEIEYYNDDDLERIVGIICD
ncbi:MAG: chromosome partitioning protein ParB [Clostridiales bacterium GWE2_32_10]|nr:MAG: chromosome partitioning protein ParB [Clostridiales bacterium GWE2_32_10]HBY20594.1 chromosome partitioning protein ParB [Clostridiales bacterium]